MRRARSTRSKRAARSIRVKVAPSATSASRTRAPAATPRRIARSCSPVRTISRPRSKSTSRRPSATAFTATLARTGLDPTDEVVDARSSCRRRPPRPAVPVVARDRRVTRCPLTTRPRRACPSRRCSCCRTADVAAPRLTDSQQFVIADSPPPGEPAMPAMDGPMISARGRDRVAPAIARAVRRNGPIPLSQLATEDLVRPDEGSEAVRARAGRLAGDPRLPSA